MRALKLCIAIVLLPACAAFTMSAWHIVHSCLFSGVVAAVPAASPAPTARDGRYYTSPGVAFAAGYGLWLAVFALLPKPMRTYVLGHELTHALWALMMGARVTGLRVAKTGGQVRTSKTNWLITLAPYFFPFYAMLFLALFFLGHAIWNWERSMAALFFFVGLGWSFHVTFTLMMLLSVRQPDVQSQGWLFSMVAIYCMNLLTMMLMTALLSRSVSCALLAHTLGRDLLAAYGWMLDRLIELWQHARNLL